MATHADIFAAYAHRTKDIKEAAARYKTLETIFLEKKDKELLEMLHGILDSCRRYIDALVVHQHKLEKLNKDAENKPLDLQRAIEVADQSRKAAHDALIDYVLIFNRLASKKYGWKNNGGIIPVGGAYTLDPLCLNHKEGCRGVVTEWAVCLVLGIDGR